VKTYLRLLGYLRPYRARLTLALACMVFYAVMSAASLGMVAPFMRILFEHSGTAVPVAIPGAPAVAAPAADRLAGWPAPLKHWAEGALLDARPLVALERVCVVILLALLLKNLADYLQAYLMVSVEQAAIRDLRSALFAHLMRLPLRYFQEARGGALMSRMTNDVEYLRASLAAGIGNLVKDSLTLIGCLTWVFLASWRLALLSLAILPPAAWALVLIGRKMRRRSTRAQEKMGELSSVVQETATGARVVKGFGMEDYERGRFDSINADFYRAFVRLRRVSAAARPVSEYAIVMVAVVMLWVGGHEIFVSHSLQPQQFVLFVTALLSTISPIKTLSEVNANVQQGVSAAERIFSVLDAPPTELDRPGARPLPALRSGIRYEHVSFSYEKDRPVLHDVSFEVRRGEVVALVGASGSGKSTLLDLLARFEVPAEGRITLDGTDTRDGTLVSLRGQLGIVTQETLLFHDSVLRNIAYGHTEVDRRAVEAAARAAHAHEFISKLPLGYDTMIGERGSRLSGGERQRLAIARALLRNPAILLLDEATSALDTESERLVQAALETLMKDRTVLVVAHRLSTIQHADRIVVMEAGRVAATGTHAELMEDGGVYRRLYELQFAG
jgi:subfamily B ATP-binding cassette protein MsbA